jgi:hypothetical protein
VYFEICLLEHPCSHQTRENGKRISIRIENTADLGFLSEPSRKLSVYNIRGKRQSEHPCESLTLFSPYQPPHYWCTYDAQQGD